jgi:hypothetical protein
LGVLCELAAEAGVVDRTILPEATYNVSFDDSLYLLPESVMEWAGLNETNPTVEVVFDDVKDTAAAEVVGFREEPDVWASVALAELNDHEIPFDVIANVIEAKL